MAVYTFLALPLNKRHRDIIIFTSQTNTQSIQIYIFRQTHIKIGELFSILWLYAYIHVYFWVVLVINPYYCQKLQIWWTLPLLGLSQPIICVLIHFIMCFIDMFILCNKKDVDSLGRYNRRKWLAKFSCCRINFLI